MKATVQTCVSAPFLFPPLALPSHQEGTAMAVEWPLQDFLELGPLPTAVGCARSHATQLLWEWGVPELRPTVELLVSELMTNAIKASQLLDHRPPVRFWLLSDKQRVLILVWDANPQPPRRIDADDDAETGRGLLLVEAISRKWDWYPDPQTGGKVVWAVTA